MSPLLTRESLVRKYYPAVFVRLIWDFWGMQLLKVVSWILAFYQEESLQIHHFTKDGSNFMWWFFYPHPHSKGQKSKHQKCYAVALRRKFWIWLAIIIILKRILVVLFQCGFSPIINEHFHRRMEKTSYQEMHSCWEHTWFSFCMRRKVCHEPFIFFRVIYVKWKLDAFRWQMRVKVRRFVKN